MSTKQAILASLLVNGPANMSEICISVLSTRGVVDYERVCQELHQLIRESKVAVSMGKYSAV